MIRPFTHYRKISFFRLLDKTDQWEVRINYDDGRETFAISACNLHAAITELCHARSIPLNPHHFTHTDAGNAVWVSEDAIPTNTMPIPKLSAELAEYLAPLRSEFPGDDWKCVAIGALWTEWQRSNQDVQRLKELLEQAQAELLLMMARS